MTAFIREIAPDALEVRIDGKLHKSDYEAFNAEAEKRIQEHGAVNLLIHMVDFEGWSPAALWEDLKFDVKHYGDVSRLAVVGEGDHAEWAAKLSKPFTRAEVQYFTESQMDGAREWLRTAVPAE